jgi:hypothetical protein
MKIPEPGQLVEVKLGLTYSECTGLIAWVGLIRNITRGRNTDEAVAWFDQVSHAERRQFVNAATFLAKFVEEEIIDDPDTRPEEDS